ncbi:MAG: PH domain-containing protein [Candidatus Bathyarchaeota archaeon]|nr:PH domain-containing protein [Candidatus Bathyarchaeota archaeon]
MAEQNEQVEALPLIQKRRLLGIIIPAINLPFFAFNAYRTVTLYLSGAPMNSEDFYSSAVLTVATLLLAFALPQWVPVYASKYTLEATGLKIGRLLKGSVSLPYSEIARAEVYIREPGEIPEDAIEYTRTNAEKLRKTGFGFVDFTNSESNIVLLMSGRKIYMISPAKPRAFLKSLKKRAPKLTAKIVELNAKGKTIQELE